jgi:hypothetical protein
MRCNLLSGVAFLALFGAVVGCTSSNSPPAASGGPSADGEQYRLVTEPAGAKGVKEVKATSKDEEEVIVVGRIGGDVNPWIEGQAAFLIVDPSLKPCNEKDDDACPTPWDYCCDTDQLPECKAMVKVGGPDGKTVATDARQLLGLKELQTVVVHGRAKRDEAGNLTVLADGVFVR